jgi:DNA adenine methylase
MGYNVPHPVPYQGSKRLIAPYILQFFPQDVETLYEPFSGSAAVSILAAMHGKANRFFLSDLNEPLMQLWNSIVNSPRTLSDGYKQLWEEQLGDERAFYDKVRADFNLHGDPHRMLYLLARCVKASIRYNAAGQFNQSPDNRRLGRNPRQMADEINAVSNLLKGRTTIKGCDYRQTLDLATVKDLVYLDPPYQGTSTNRDQRYIRGLSLEEVAGYLQGLNDRNVRFILSYDGQRGDQVYGKPLPKSLNLTHLSVHAGRSTQSTLLGRRDQTIESLYLSPALVDEIEVDSVIAALDPQFALSFE